MTAATKLPSVHFGKGYAKKPAPEMFLAPGGTLFELSKRLGGGEEGDFKMARRTNRFGETDVRAVKTPLRNSKVITQALKRELEAMVACHSALGGELFTTDTGEVFLVMRLADNHLQNAIWNIFDAAVSRSMIEACVIDVLYQVTKRIAVLHAMKYAHRDLKTENIFVTLSGEVFVGDFGKASNKGTAETNPTGSPGMLSPSMLRGETAVMADDLWMVGVIAAQLIMDQHPFHPDRDFGHLSQADFMAHWREISVVEMDGYLRYRQGDKAQTIGHDMWLRVIKNYKDRLGYLKEYHTWFWGELRSRAPNLAPVIEALLNPNATERPDINEVHAAVGILKQRHPVQDLKPAWAYVQRDPAIDAQLKEFEKSYPRVPALEALALEAPEAAKVSAVVTHPPKVCR